ncbi:SH2 domain-containing protein 2A [Pteropus vampyrus]|uniref:SH2 domain-containing protein 2A n=1 Tax=Pteropus vampyrus TaxID=132908 RepID=A0A6P3QKN8_PTEVA|nr:SH2 domain-containing protein 2A [Pteropus vampyrus]
MSARPENVVSDGLLGDPGGGGVQAPNAEQGGLPPLGRGSQRPEAQDTPAVQKVLSGSRASPVENGMAPGSRDKHGRPCFDGLAPTHHPGQSGGLRGRRIAPPVTPPTPPTRHRDSSPPALGTATRPEDAGQAEEVPREGGQLLQAETRAWFQKTQAHGLLQHGAAPPWFHGFITRREAERLLEPQPLGCYLVRFSESVVTFVLTYRSQTCCRHFLLAQLRDGSHVVLGEDSTHARLQDLLQHYTACPLGPYGETLSQPLARQVRRAPTLTWDPGPDPVSQSPGRGSRLRMLSRGTDCRPRLPRTRVSVASPSGKMPAGAQGSSRDQPSHRDRRG